MFCPEPTLILWLRLDDFSIHENSAAVEDAATDAACCCASSSASKWILQLEKHMSWRQLSIFMVKLRFFLSKQHSRYIKGVFLSKKKGEREEDSNKWVNWFLVINLPEILGTFKPFIQCYFFSRDFQSASSETLSDAEGNLSAARNSASTVSSSALQQSRKAVQESCIFCNCKNWNLKSFLTQIQQRLSRGFN